MKSTSARRWLPLLILGVVCVLVYLTRPIWLTWVAASRHPIHIRCGGIGFDLRGQWMVTDISDTESSFLRVVPGHRMIGKATPTILVVEKYANRHPEVEEQARRDDDASARVSIKLGQIVYNSAQPVTLAGHRGVKLFGSDDVRDYLRIDLPDARVAITFIILEGGVGRDGADKIAMDAVTGLSLGAAAHPP